VLCLPRGGDVAMTSFRACPRRDAARRSTAGDEQDDEKGVTGTNWLTAIAKAARRRFMGDMLQITEQEAAAVSGSRGPAARTSAAPQPRSV